MRKIFLKIAFILKKYLKHRKTLFLTTVAQFGV